MKPPIEREWDADEEQYYLENPDEWPGLDDGFVLGHKYDEDNWIDLHVDEHGLTAEGQQYLGEKDTNGDFV
jgi:hypothetical protein